MAAPTGAFVSASQKAGRLAVWYARTRDVPEVLLLYGWIAGVLGMAVYTMKRDLFSNEAGSYVDINIRGNPDKQVETARLGLEDPAKVKHSFWWHVAQVKIDKDGANIGVLWDNRTRPHQYSKPGEAGIAAGVNVAAV